MGLILANRVQVDTSSTGLTDFVIGAAVSAAYQDFDDAGIPDASIILYSAYTDTQFECGQGVYSVGSPSGTLSRDVIFASSNASAKVNFSTNPRVVLSPLGQTPPPGFVTPEMFGAVGDGAADDTVAVQAAFDASNQVLLPNVYNLTSTVTMTGGEKCIKGHGPAHSGLRTTQNIPLITFDVSGGDGYFNSISDMFFVGSGSYGANEACIKVTGTNAHQFSFAHIFNLKAYQITNGIQFYNNASGDSFVNWCNFNNISIFGCTYGIHYVEGAGTGCVYSNLVCTLNGNAGASCMKFGDGTEAVGDMMISNCEWGGVGDGITIDGGSYGSGIAINNTDNDAGIVNAVNLTRCSNIQISNQVLGGGAAWSIDNTTCTEIFMPIVAGLTPSTITGSQNNYNPTGLERAGYLKLTTNAAGYNITGLAGGFDGRKLQIRNFGANSFTLSNADAASSVLNRFRLGGSATIGVQQSINLIYSSGNQGWIRDGGQ